MDTFLIGGVINNIVLDIISSGGKIGVNIFCLIMGFFGVQSKYEYKKIVAIESEVMFYSLLGLLLGVLFCKRTISTRLPSDPHL